ncbi:MAG: helix-turn-helix transcriptional regulator [Coriobacteriia bacterium]|nr:helix-turn-helix transcriptional regulator [Coriobacteriia bacterium]MCL2750641.1 helix-turn-helix transcriptional regulator [Coriobacteriia bacterium]
MQLLDSQQIDDLSISGTPLLDKSCLKITQQYRLTQRESEILRYTALGRSAKYIAHTLHISHNTARTHVKHVYEKLNIHSKQDLIDLVLSG